MGLRQLRVIDRDKVEPHNLSTQPWQSQDVGAPKARILANALYRAVGARVDAQQVELTAANAAKHLKESAVVVDAFDNIPSRRAVIDATAKLSIPCLHIALGSDGAYGCGLWDAAYVLPNTPSGADTCDYPLARSLALIVAVAGAEVVAGYLASGQRRGFEVTLRDLTMTAV
jgi:molybdopterin-synthase adenylyltransferase